MSSYNQRFDASHFLSWDSMAPGVCMNEDELQAGWIFQEQPNPEDVQLEAILDGYMLDVQPTLPSIDYVARESSSHQAGSAPTPFGFLAPYYPVMTASPSVALRQHENVDSYLNFGPSMGFKPPIHEPKYGSPPVDAIAFVDAAHTARLANASHIQDNSNIPQTTDDGTYEGSASLDTEALDSTTRNAGDLRSHHVQPALAHVSNDDAQGTWAPSLLRVDEGPITNDLLLWLSNLIFPKNRSDKRTPAPKGRCELCGTTCTTSGILKTHVQAVHRRSLARNVIMGLPYSLALALSFVIIEIEASGRSYSQDLLEECHRFRVRLPLITQDLYNQQSDSFPLLRNTLRYLCDEEPHSWKGYECSKCGALLSSEDKRLHHTRICRGSRNTGSHPPMIDATAFLF